MKFLLTNCCQNIFIFLAFILIIPFNSLAQQTMPTESDYYTLVDLPVPDEIVLEVGGMDLLPDGRLAVCTRRGEVWIIENPSAENGQQPSFHLFAEGLHEPLGLAYKDSAFYIAQRPELTRIEDTDGDGVADHYETILDRKITGNYHEYAFGPVFLPDGDMIVTYNLAWVGTKMESPSRWDGWLVKVSPDGRLTPLAAGMRSPAGIALNKHGDIFYSENQGGWVGSGNITHIETGDFVGHPAGLGWSSLPDSPLLLEPEAIPNTGRSMHEIARKIPELKTPSVWLPHGVLGISTSDILLNDIGDAFGPFEGQLFVGDQGQSMIVRVFQEKIDGEYQGAAFPFKSNFKSGVFRMSWSTNNSMFVGMTSRGWASTGGESYGLQELVWNGKIPFEIKEIHAKPDGFEVVFTKPVDKQKARDSSLYAITGFTYKYHSTYGSPIIDRESVPVKHVQVGEDGLTARLVIDNLQEGHIYEIKAEGVREVETGHPLLHSVGYYTLKNIPDGEKLAVPENERDAVAVQTRGGDTEADDTTKHQIQQPSAWNDGPDEVITINAATALKFDQTSFEVKAGSRVKLEFNNPTDMLHNLLIVQPGALENVAREALNMGLDGPQQEYVPAIEEVLFYTSLLEVEDSEAIYFTAPEQPADYPYVCTFPGHWQTMQGIMKVVE